MSSSKKKIKSQDRSSQEIATGEFEFPDTKLLDEEEDQPKKKRSYTRTDYKVKYIDLLEKELPSLKEQLKPPPILKIWGTIILPSLAILGLGLTTAYCSIKNDFYLDNKVLKCQNNAIINCYGKCSHRQLVEKQNICETTK